ncbi:MAG: hypothetical protein J6P77_03175, partial [Acetobacter sp.]|nr:hypothetical protein [Acetobacter sp.]
MPRFFLFRFSLPIIFILFGEGLPFPRLIYAQTFHSTAKKTLPNSHFGGTLKVVIGSSTGTLDPQIAYTALIK